MTKTVARIDVKPIVGLRPRVPGQLSVDAQTNNAGRATVRKNESEEPVTEDRPRGALQRKP